MAGYQRKTAFSSSEVLNTAEEFLPVFVGLSKTNSSPKSATYSGTEGTVTITVHPHGPYSEVTVSTDKLRTSRVDYEVQRYLAKLPYEPGDTGVRWSGEAT